jgi:hypothetical protein
MLQKKKKPYAIQSSHDQHNNLDLPRMASLLERLEARLNKLEAKEIKEIGSEFIAHNRS